VTAKVVLGSASFGGVNIHRVWVLLIVLSVPLPAQQQGSKSTAVEPEEHAVYSALIREMYLSKNVDLIVIDDHTSKGHHELSEIVDGMKGMFRGQVEPAALEDFRAKNQEEHPLDSRLNLEVRYVLISKAEAKKLFEGGQSGPGKGWDGFYAKYPRSQGIMTLSRVGFNEKRDQAVLYVGNQSHWLAGAGFYVFLAKKDGSWVILNRKMVWISGAPRSPDFPRRRSFPTSCCRFLALSWVLWQCSTVSEDSRRLRRRETRRGHRLTR